MGCDTRLPRRARKRRCRTRACLSVGSAIRSVKTARGSSSVSMTHRSNAVRSTNSANPQEVSGQTPSIKCKSGETAPSHRMRSPRPDVPMSARTTEPWLSSKPAITNLTSAVRSNRAVAARTNVSAYLRVHTCEGRPCWPSHRRRPDRLPSDLAKSWA